MGVAARKQKGSLGKAKTFGHNLKGCFGTSQAEILGEKIHLDLKGSQSQKKDMLRDRLEQSTFGVSEWFQFDWS